MLREKLIMHEIETAASSSAEDKSRLFKVQLLKEVLKI